MIGYVRVSTEGQASERSHGLTAQWRALEAWCRALGHVLVTVIPEVASTRHPERMYGRLAVEAALRAGLADAMVVRDIDRASRSTLDGAQLLGRAHDKGWRVVGTDGVDSADPEQEFLVNVRLAMAQEERRKIARRTREGLESARAQGKRLGRPRSISPTLARRIVRYRMKDGLSAQAIAALLTDKKVPAPGGGDRWHRSTVRRVLAREGVE
ncbi:recombinase [Pseudonocardia sp. D17]|nr:recombinase [Pseudonocardia sp. D17]